MCTRLVNFESGARDNGRKALKQKPQLRTTYIRLTLEDKKDASENSVANSISTHMYQGGVTCICCVLRSSYAGQNLDQIFLKFCFDLDQECQRDIVA